MEGEVAVGVEVDEVVAVAAFASSVNTCHNWELCVAFWIRRWRSSGKRDISPGRRL